MPPFQNETKSPAAVEARAISTAGAAAITVVVDTNIFVSQLAQLRRLMDQSGEVGGGTVVIYVPWAVFRELDALKSR